MAWFDDLASVYLFERDARRELGALQRRQTDNPRRLVYGFVLNVPVYDEQRKRGDRVRRKSCCECVDLP